MQKQIDDICRFNELMGNHKGNVDHINPDKRDAQAKLILEEYAELQHEIIKPGEKYNPLSFRKELCDFVVVTVGMAHILGMETSSLGKAWFRQSQQNASNNCLNSKTPILTLMQDGEPYTYASAVSYLLLYAQTLAQTHDIDIEKDLQAVNVSNFSKFCETQQEVERTILMYDNFEIDYEIRDNGELTSFISTKDQTGTNGKFYSKGKLLKPKHYIPAELV